MTSPFGKSLAFPPRVGANGRMLWSEGEDNIRESIAIILKTMQCERVQLPGFGANLGSYLFEPNNAGTHARIARDIEIALGQWEPRIALDDVAIAADSSDAVVTISYRLVASGAAESIAVAVPLGAQ
jgi:phage baseplate assembly protein W